MLNLILFGAPGAGKGTQAELLIKTFGLIHISTGELLRAEIKNGTELGKKAKKFMDKGNLVPDELVIDVIKNKLNSCQNVKGFVFDGFPRTVAQAEALDELLCKNCMSISGMLSLEVEKQELIRRLIGRGLKYGRIDDQEQSVIEYRINVYNEKTLPLIEYYKKQGKHYGISGKGTIQDIADRLKAVVEKL
ncbi:MAG: adenylate kinase [Bacteroidales bacterium]|jgi:adenylate kinase|nr:adenylate kinase [Mariniphaga sp.]NLB93959.1 adenylate kinase [Bacteroidales bacterium]